MKKTAALFLAVAAFGQAPVPTVITSVKPTPGAEDVTGPTTLRRGLYRQASGTVVTFLNHAYGLPANRILGAPDWASRDRWDVEAKVETVDGATPMRADELARVLLRDRFKLDAVMEKRERPIYAMRLLRGDGMLGPNLARSKIECDDAERTRQLRTSGVKGVHGESPCGVVSQRDALSFAGMSLLNLIGPIYADRVIQDQTGLTGPFDLTLTWTYTGDPVADQAAMYSAMREQLGLKLESATAPLDVLVIKSVSRPTPN